MISRAFRNLLCAAAAAMFGAYGTAAHAIAYDVGFDPPFVFGGFMTIDVSSSCLTPVGEVHGCIFDVLSLDFFDTGGNEWGITSPQTGAGSAVSIDAGGMLVAISAFLSPVVLLSDTGGCSEFDASGTPSLSFTIDSLDHSKTDVSFACGSRTIDTGTVTSITRVPEPATLALLSLGLGIAGFVARRRQS